MANIYLTLGDVVFQDFEVPEAISFGSRQCVAVHELIGGGRVVDVIGRQPETITFSGTFSGINAAERAQSLDTACTAGASVALGWDSFYFEVVIAKFSADYKKPYWIPFSLICVLTSSNVGSISQSISASRLIEADFEVVSQWASQAGISSINLNQTSAIQVQVACSNTINSAGAQVLADQALITHPATPSVAINAIVDILKNSENLAAGAYVAGYIGRAVDNISLAAL